MKMTKKALEEIAKYELNKKEDYILAFHAYIESYQKRPPIKSTPIKNMLRALRMLPWHNSPDDWARLHATEAILNK